ncbi:MAG: hypothetical protein IT445_15445 [Phycisphaeraceae bacterium]|nr:hypothetical protein [Phycisphaeraceae bacterium]
MNQAQDTVNLSGLLRRLLRGAIAAGLLAAVIAAVVWVGGLLTIRPTYQGLALVQFSDPPIYPNFADALIGVTPLVMDRKSLPLQAVSAEVMARTFADASLATYADREQELDKARESMTCNIFAKTTMDLSVRSADPQLAADVANAWAEAVVWRLNQDNGINDSTITLLEERTEAAREHWAGLHKQWAGKSQAAAPPAGGSSFEADRLAVDIEVARNLYFALSQALEQARLSRDVSRESISVSLRALPQDRPSNPQPRRYAAMAGLIIFSVSLFIVLVVELSRLER